MENLLQEATLSMVQLHELTKTMKNGSTPDALSLLGIQSDLVDFYRKIGEELSRKFGTKEKAYLNRKIEAAQQYKKGRLEKLTSTAATEAALLAVGEEYMKEIEAAESYELHRTFLKSLQNAIDYSRSVVSFIKTSETNPSS